MSAKPLHIGHWAMIERAATENDVVRLFVSTSDRARPGELPILGADMLAIWKRYLVKRLPKNVKPTFGGIPVKQTYEALDALSDRADVTKVRIYAGREDLSVRFTEKSLLRYATGLYEAGKIELVETPRTTSGTHMRGLIAAGKQAEFEELLPPVPEADKHAIWALLSSRVERPQTEALIRRIVASAISAG